MCAECTRIPYGTARSRCSAAPTVQMQVVQVMRVLHVVLALLAARGCDARELRFAADMQAVALAGQRAGS